MPKISVIIPTFNRGEMVVKCVQSVLATNYPELEVIVVDDCSPDETRQQINAAYANDPRVRYQRNERNSFQAVSRNTGCKTATGELLFFLDDDNLVHPNIFDELTKAFAHAPTAGFVAPLAIHRRPGKENVIWSLGSDFNRWTSQPKDVSPNLPLSEFQSVSNGSELRPTTYYPNAFMVTAKAFDEVGGFDETYEQIFEESDFGWKIGEAGYSRYLAINARTDHLGFLEPGCVPELRQLGIEKPRRTYCFARNRLKFARKHFSFLQILSVTFVFAPLSCGYYCLVALKNKRPDIAWAYLRGTIRGMLGLS